jgi:hypothetical protein
LKVEKPIEGSVRFGVYLGLTPFESPFLEDSSNIAARPGAENVGKRQREPVAEESAVQGVEQLRGGLVRVET